MGRLLEGFRAVKEQNVYLKEENTKLKAQVAESHEELLNFKNQQKIDMIATGITGNTHQPAELKATIDGYIREIDKCIAYLNE
ncbi:MAG: hypothetical protein K2Q22_06095 [Cytophagales bacterium]|nr:hypothetical protein [Cytophagales bacterium]